MASINKKLSGCYRRVLLFLLAISVGGLIAGGFAYRRVGGVDGARYWMAERALNGVEKHLLKNRPDGIPEEQVVTLFRGVRQAIGNQQVDLTRLYETLKAYQTSFHTTKPSTPEVEQFFGKLTQAIFSDEPQ